jgi:tRNA(adenine34) deaminase
MTKKSEFTPEQLRFFMHAALREAQQAMDEDEVPVGAVLVASGQIIARGHNMSERLHDATAHAEMIALTSGSEYLGSKYLNDCTLFVTLEPCAMCAAAGAWSQLGGLVFGASDPQKGFRQMAGSALLHPKTRLTGGILSDESEKLLKEFFSRKRKDKEEGQTS